ncbi:unnamed protein product [Caenorhabditis angaria]|uniref:Thioredoxin domain-containing protein n=1 Tax=Caenorhabditis angaria TaxID=860376 RepID=A0A9P1IVC8_9PELO|nr:unnamed protein product [Caenorhabditis angaria]
MMRFLVPLFLIAATLVQCYFYNSLQQKQYPQDFEESRIVDLTNEVKFENVMARNQKQPMFLIFYGR